MTIFVIATEQSDAGQFTVAGRLASKPPVQLPFGRPEAKRAPAKCVLRSSNPTPLGLAKSPSMMVPLLPSMLLASDNANNNSSQAHNNPSANDNAKVTNGASAATAAATASAIGLLRSISVPSEQPQQQRANVDNDYDDSNAAQAKKVAVPALKVSVHRADDDETFVSFYSSSVGRGSVRNGRNGRMNGDDAAAAASKTSSGADDVQIADFDAVAPTQRLVQKRTVQGPRNRRANASGGNPLKALAARRDLQTEYTEIRTGIADKELRRMKMESSELCAKGEIHRVGNRNSIE